MSLQSSKNTNRHLIGFLCIALLITSIVLSIGFFLGYKNANNKQQIFRILVSNSISRFFILKNTSKSTVARLRNDLRAVECPANHVAIATFGQSNSANRVLRDKGLIARNWCKLVYRRNCDSFLKGNNITLFNFHRPLPS